MTTPRRQDLGERIFRIFLWLYPRSFRERFLDEMLDFFQARRAEQRHRFGARSTARLWGHLLADIVLTAPLQRLRALRHASARELPWASPEYPQENHPMETLRQDIRFAIRALARHPAFALVAGLTLALGIGATTAIFSVVDAVLLRPLPWPDADRLVMVFGTRSTGSRRDGVVYLDFKDWQAQSKAFEEMGIIRGQSVNLTGGDSPDRVIGSFVTAGTFRTLGATAMQGRLFADAETEVATRQPVAVVNEATWRARFGSRPDMVGSTLILNGEPFTVVGIMRPGFAAPLGTPDVWMPVGYYPNRGDLETRGRPGVLVVGKLKFGVTAASAQADLDELSRRIALEHPAANAGRGANVEPLKEMIVSGSRAPLLIVLASVGVVLLIACANVANLQLARAASRRRELSVRAALGAGRKRLMRQLLTESLVLSAAGGVAGIGFAYVAVRWLGSAVPNVVPIFGDVTLSRDVLLFAIAVTVFTGILFGVAPAWQASRARIQETLTVRGGGSAGARLGTRGALVVGQIALCVVLLVTAGLLTRSLVALSAVKPGFDVEQLLTLQFRLAPTKYDTEEKIAEMFSRSIEEIRGVAGVESAALARATPLNGNGDRLPYEIDGRVEPDPRNAPTANANIVSPGYFETMRIPRTAGRDFTTQDRAGSLPVAIVNEQMARKIAPSGGGSALGARVRLLDGDAPVWATVIGVVGNTRHFQLSEPPLDQVYVPFTQKPLIFTEAVVRTIADPMTVANPVREAIWRVDPDQPVWGVRPVEASIERALGGRRFTMGLMASFAILAVVLATIGVYGVMSYMVARRTQEMGIRMALGARATQVVGLVLRQGARSIALAIGIGLAGAFLATRLLESQLFGVTSTDPLTYALAPLILGAVALIACFLPARRASRVDPVVALRAE